MHTKLFLPACFQLAVIFVLANVLLISATPSPLQPSRRGLLTQREPILQRRDNGDTPPGLPPAWIQQACLTDDPFERTLTSNSFTNSTGMTVALCANFCNDNFNTMAGLENGQDCFCGNITTAAAVILPSSDCNTPCVGNSSEICGGPNRLSTLWNGFSTQPEPVFREGVEGWNFVGCFDDSETARVLPVKTPVVGGQFGNSVEDCALACELAGFSLAGMEFAIECWCGNSISPGSTAVDLSLATTTCPLACPNDSYEYCGGHLSLVLYNHTGPGGFTGHG